MTDDELRATVKRRLDAGKSGDRGWFLITRVHLNATRLRNIASYLYEASGGRPISLTGADYSTIAKAVGVTGDNPGQTLRRHQLLAMDEPLGLVARMKPPRWEKVSLTDIGQALATTTAAGTVLEPVLRELVFCSEPWFSAARVKKYEEFNVHPYLATLDVLGACDGWIDRDEYDLFTSRIRTADEINWAVAGIRAFRKVGTDLKRELLHEVEVRIDGSKSYQNWRDTGLHTFSLFALGTSVLRLETRLVLAGDIQDLPPVAHGSAAARPSSRRKLTLDIPTPRATEELVKPPVAIEANSGSDGEVAVGKLLSAAGWQVVYYTNRRGFGFDIWAAQGDSAIVIEVKSSLAKHGALSLTRIEYEAAKHHAGNYLIAVVENLGSGEPEFTFISDPAATLAFEETKVAEFRAKRESWAAIGTASIKP